MSSKTGFILAICCLIFVSATFGDQLEDDGGQIKIPKSKDESSKSEEESSTNEHKKPPEHGPRNGHTGAPGANGDYERAGPDTVHLIKDARELADSSLGFWHGFIASLSVIIVSELGDKTWFIAAIMAMRHSRLTVFSGAIAALALMTVLSSCLGWATQIIPRKLTYYVSTALFALFGLKMLKEGYDMSPDMGQEEYEEAQAEVQKKEEEIREMESNLTSGDVEKGTLPAHQNRRSATSVVLRFMSKIFIEAFTLTFLAEWGDRSQITTIILAAREDVVGVTMGGTLGHAICTGIAVLGGRLVAQRISIRTVTIIGGVVFIVFALSALVVNPEGS